MAQTPRPLAAHAVCGFRVHPIAVLQVSAVAPETVYIFQGKLDPWAASLGFAGVFAPGGIFSAKVGQWACFELIASLLLLAGAAMSSTRTLQVLGAALRPRCDQRRDLLHLFTPLGVAVVNTDGSSDGGELFALACGVWLACVLLLWIRRAVWLGWLAHLTATESVKKNEPVSAADSVQAMR